MAETASVHSDLPYRIVKVCYDITPKDTFTRRRGEGEETISFVDYNERKGATVNNMDQPMLECVRPGRKQREGEEDHIVPELALLSGIPKAAQEELPKLCSKKPRDRYTFLRDFARDLQQPGSRSAEGMQHFGIELGEEFVSVDDRSQVLPHPRVVIEGVFDRMTRQPEIVNDNQLFKRNGWAPATARMRFSKPRRDFFVYVTYSEGDERFAEEWTDQILSSIERSGAPIRWGGADAVRYFGVKDGRHCEALEANPPTHSVAADGAPCVLWLCFNRSGDEQTWREFKAFANRVGIISQCIGAKARTGPPVPIQKNLAKQICIY